MCPSACMCMRCRRLPDCLTAQSKPGPLAGSPRARRARFKLSTRAELTLEPCWLRGVAAAAAPDAACCPCAACCGVAAAAPDVGEGGGAYGRPHTLPPLTLCGVPSGASTLAAALLGVALPLGCCCAGGWSGERSVGWTRKWPGETRRWLYGPPAVPSAFSLPAVAAWGEALAACRLCSVCSASACTQAGGMG